MFLTINARKLSNHFGSQKAITNLELYLFSITFA